MKRIKRKTDRVDFPGSKWWRFDFHTHTPASDDFGRGNETLKNILPEEWLQKAMESGIDCVAVADHNTGGWIDRLKEKNEELKKLDTRPQWFRELILFPGVEITVADSSGRVHLLAVFDPSCDSQKVTACLGACGIDKGFGDDKNTSTTKGFLETVEEIKKCGGIAIPAHIDENQGLLDGKTSLAPELKKSLNSVIAGEFCKLNAFDNADPELKKEVNRLAKIAGSDAHKPDEIGRYFSWVKMSKPSIEGLRLALSDHEFCVKNQIDDPNGRPGIYLSKLTIKNMRHCGRVKDRPFIMEFHPHFNSIIGGRGTGKSTVLESIRIVSRRDQDLASEAPKVKDELDKFMKLSQNKGVMQNDTEIQLEIHRSRKLYALRWRYDGQEPVLKEKVETGWITQEQGDLKERFRMSIFSQKQINELALNPRGLLDIVDRHQDVNRSEWKTRWESMKSQFLQLREQERELSRQLAGEGQIRVKLSDIENDLKQYEEKGHGEILKRYQKYSQQNNSLPDDRIFDELEVGLRELAEKAELSDFPMHVFDEGNDETNELRMAHEKTTQQLKEVGNSLLGIEKKVDEIKNLRKKSIESSKWFQSVQKSINDYKGLEKEYEEKNSRISISLYGEWVRQRDQLQLQIKKLESVLKEKKRLEKQIHDALNKLLNLRTELFENRRNFLNKVIGINPYVRMDLVPLGDVSTLEDDYREHLNLEGDKFTSSVYDPENSQGILLQLMKWEDSRVPESQLPELIQSIKSETFDIARGEMPGNHGTFNNRLKKLFETQPSTFDHLDAWWPEDMLRVRYAKDIANGKFDDLEKGSAGQKAAAILAFLLSHGNEPFIIDQPEDDLDNALITDLVVKQIHENKEKRQIIIVTHNPNIVVNGDSELVHVLKFEGGQVQIDQEGGLEESEIRRKICDIMEGGRTAFDKRYKRITMEI